MKSTISKELKAEKVKDKYNSFTINEVTGFIRSTHAQMLHQRYLAKLAEKAPNPRLDAFGQEVLNPHSVVAEIDLQPLSMRQNISRFVSHENVSSLEDYDFDNDESFHSSDRIDNPPTPHELRSMRLDKKLTAVREAQRKAEEAAKEKAATTPNGDKKGEPTPKSSPEEQAKS
nr:MAG: hypothetical protein [Microvirus sp.]